jgi:hypothetical protein
VAEEVIAGELHRAYQQLAPTLTKRTPFAKLGIIGEAIGTGPAQQVYDFLDLIAEEKTQGGWVVIGHALACHWDRDPQSVFEQCRRFILAAQVWYATDTLAERVPGPALVKDFDIALALLDPWRFDPDRWVRRAVGVAVHFWAKRSRGEVERSQQAASLLKFLEPNFAEWDMNAVKGIAWGLKTLGRQYPDLMANWLAQQVANPDSRYRSHTLRKALLFLDEEQRTRVLGSKIT